MISSTSEIICDWLDVTYSPDSQLIGSAFKSGVMTSWLMNHSAICKKRDERSIHFSIGDHGYIKLDSSSMFSRVSASGRALAHFRAQGIFMEYLDILASEPHRVTRLDAALDIPRDGANVIKEFKKKYPSGSAPLGRKNLKMNFITGFRSDGKESGSCYFGQRTKARQTARVYDKALEALDKRGEQMPPTTRYEVTAKGERDRPSPTLRDAAEPTSIFWHIASPTLLKAPKGIKPWISGDGESWKLKRPELLPAEIVERKIEFSAELDTIAAIASQMGSGGLQYMLRQIAKKYHIDMS